jgi:hypothetical protein
MTIKQFIKDCALLENPVGDLAKDILRDENFNSKKTEKEMIDYLEFQTLIGGTNDVFKKFLSEYKKNK